MPQGLIILSDSGYWETLKTIQCERMIAIQLPKKAMPKSAQTAAQLHSSHTLVK